VRRVRADALVMNAHLRALRGLVRKCVDIRRQMKIDADEPVVPAQPLARSSPSSASEIVQYPIPLQMRRPRQCAISAVVTLDAGQVGTRRMSTIPSAMTHRVRRRRVGLVGLVGW
jgi:hypothetical protein